MVRVLAHAGSARSAVGAALDTSPARSPRRGAVSATLCGTARAPATARVLLSARFCCALLCLVTRDGLLDAGMRRSRWTRSSLLVPALLIELAAETGTMLRGMNAVMCHDEVVVAAGAMARVLMLLQLLGRS